MPRSSPPAPYLKLHGKAILYHFLGVPQEFSKTLALLPEGTVPLMVEVSTATKYEALSERNVPLRPSIPQKANGAWDRKLGQQVK